MEHANVASSIIMPVNLRLVHWFADELLFAPEQQADVKTRDVSSPPKLASACEEMTT
jgi:hypothetical protein